MGARWHFRKAPAVRFFNDAGASRGQVSRVSSVVFASRRDGWLYGPGLWSTRDGGARWHRLSLGGGIDAMAASAGTVYAVVSPHGGGREELYRSSAGKDAWARAIGRRPHLEPGRLPGGQLRQGRRGSQPRRVDSS